MVVIDSVGLVMCTASELVLLFFLIMADYGLLGERGRNARKYATPETPKMFITDLCARAYRGHHVSVELFISFLELILIITCDLS